MQHRQAFTIIEVLVVIGILMTVAVVSLLALTNSRGSEDLNSTAQEIVSTLREAQSRTLSGSNSASWGVYFGNPTNTAPFYALFYGTYTATHTIGHYPLPADLQYLSSSITSGSSYTLTFSPVSGIPSASTTLTINLPAQNLNAYITINAPGLISYALGSAASSGGRGGIALLQVTTADCGTVTNCGLDFGDNSSAGDLYIVAVRVGGSGTETVTVTSTQGDTFTEVEKVTQTLGGGLGSAYIFYAQNVAGGSGVAFNVHQTVSQSVRVAAFEFSGLSETSPLDATSTGTGTSGTALSVSTATTTIANEIIFGWGTNGHNHPGGQSISAGSGYTSEGDVGCTCAVGEYQIVSQTTSTANTKMTQVNSDSWIDELATFH